MKSSISRSARQDITFPSDELSSVIFEKHGERHPLRRSMFVGIRQRPKCERCKRHR
jgi:hypothetical protein